MNLASGSLGFHWYDGSSLAGLGAFVLVAGFPAAAWVWTTYRVTRPVSPAQPLLGGLIVGLSVWVVLSTFLVRVSWMTQAAIWTTGVLVAGLSVGSIGVVLRRGSDGRHSGGSDGGAGQHECGLYPNPEARTSGDIPVPSRWKIRLRGRGAVVSAIFALATTAPQISVIVRRPDSLGSSTTWYYWFVSRSIAIAGGVPDHLHEWGQNVPTFRFHLGFSAVTAFLSVAGDDTDALFSAQFIRILTLLVFAIGIWALALTLGSTLSAAVAATVFVNFIQIYVVKLSSYRPETMAYGFVMLTVALLIWGLRDGNRVTLAASLVGVVGMSQLHQISALLALAFMAGAAIAYLTVGGSGAGNRKSRLRWVGSYGVIAVVGTLLANLILTGRWSEAAVGDLPAIDHGRDPTWAFARLVSGASDVERTAGLRPPSVGAMMESSLNARLVVGPGWIVVAACVAIVLLAGLCAFRSLRAREALVFGVVAFGAMLGLAYALSALGDTYIPRRTGFSRLLQLWPIIPAILIAAVSGLSPRPALRWLVSTILVAGAVAVFINGTALVTAMVNRQPPEAIKEIQSLPMAPNATVLTNAFTQDYIALLTPGFGLLDGHAPYLEKGLLQRANTIALLTRRYFKQPGSASFPFRRYGVDYVLAAKRPYGLGTPLNFYPSAVAALAKDPRLELVTTNSDFAFYRVKARA